MSRCDPYVVTPMLCVKQGTCWGKRKKFPKSIWWVKMKTKSGLIGWTKEHQNFGNMDACG